MTFLILQPLATTRSDRKRRTSIFMHVKKNNQFDVHITGLPYAMRDIVGALHLLYFCALGSMSRDAHMKNLAIEDKNSRTQHSPMHWFLNSSEIRTGHEAS